MNERENKKRLYIKWSIVALLLLATLLSVFVVAGRVGDPARHRAELDMLAQKKMTVLSLTGSATAAATAIAAVPGDATTPVADKLADLTSYFLIALAAIYIEEYLVTLTGYAAFLILLPAAFLFAIAGILLEKRSFIARGARIGLIGLVIALVIPMSIKLSNTIEQTMETSVATTMDEAQEITDEINENRDSEGNFFQQALEKIKGGVTGLIEKGEELLNKFIETIAVMLVTSCVLPVAVLLFIIWLLKMLLGGAGGTSPGAVDRLFQKRTRHSTESRES